ncbi:BPTD_3080 family restriction endonuclease [Ramlibacter sp.]|uniref:BPTD_3080 family restriction endonuclease n=1 Tax=Ramlibacter sp. TaxID=1917967 RepID=UPI003D0F955D
MPADNKPARGGGEPSPILNGPYDEPAWHYATAEDGSLDYERPIPGRRIFAPTTPQVPLGRPSQGSMFDVNDFAAEYRARIVNLVREQLIAWRKSGYEGVTSRVTRDLLAYWFLNPERPSHMQLFFAQREAVEAAIWLNEVAGKSNVGTHVLREIGLANESADDPAGTLPRICFKMATGTGKTVVMACLLLYHYLNRCEYRNDTRYADYFLIVAPGVTIRDRLAVLRVDTLAERDADASDYYRERQLVPPAFAGLLAGLNARLVITNFHGFERRQIGGNKKSPMDGKLGADGRKTVALESPAEVTRRMLPGFKPGRRMVVINDEAHHCYLPRAKGRDTDEEASATENERAAVWYSGLREVAQRWQVASVYDLSATPYYLAGSGWPAYSYFPWMVSDFGLIEAIEAGLVKIPFLPVEDNAQTLDEPTLRNLYEACKGDLPSSRGARTESGAKGLKRDLAKFVEAPPQLPPLLRQALVQFYEHYSAYDKGLREQGERRRDMFTAPPVFIVVCSNMTVSKEVYKLIAGYETQSADGQPMVVRGALDLFSNFDKVTLKPLHRPPTLLIDSDALEHSGQINDEFKRVFSTEIEQFKREYRLTHPHRSVDALTEADLLREVVNTVGRPGKLGQHIRCVVSVGMLTEGWDANTVTHIVGIRAFGSQLLCEQVAGRALRRREYFIDPKTGKFPPEYAHIIGVPFKFFKGGTSDLPTPQDIKYLRALPERADLTIDFPNVQGYKLALDPDAIEADFAGLPRFKINLAQLPTKTTLGTAFSGDTQELRAAVEHRRDQEVVYWAARATLNHYFRSDLGTVQFEHFRDVLRIAEKWYESEIDLVGATDRSLRKLIRDYPEKAVADSIYRGIEAASLQRQAAQSTEKTPRIVPLLNRYHPRGSTANVQASTAKPVFATKRSPVNFVVADTDSWEQLAAKTFEQIDAIESYVKNAFLGFEIPYTDKAGKDRRYVPDFLCRIKTPGGRRFNLIVEITGFAQDKELKRYFTLQRWLPAVNAQREKFGGLSWHFLEITDIERLKNELEPTVERIGREVDVGEATAWDVIQLLSELPDDVFDAIRELRPAEDRPGLIDDDEDAA